jgi:hypothetical protein
MDPQSADSSAPKERKLFKVAFDLPEEASGWPPVSVERLWGEKTDVRYEIRVVNTPFFVRGIAYGDLIRVRPDHERRELVFESLTAESGHSTVRVILMESSTRGELEEILRDSGCSWEVAQSESLLAVDVPPPVDYLTLRRILREIKGAGKIGIQESAISSRHREQLPDFP